ncbi:MAG: hypothetical protein HY748_15935 [Elusimicrobia bacterium]|nr:hypothetical protein [Elusimicrobiota bacterium]
MPTPLQRVEERISFACGAPFDKLPPEMVVRAFGVDYGHLVPPEVLANARFNSPMETRSTTPGRATASTSSTGAPTSG